MGDLAFYAASCGKKRNVHLFSTENILNFSDRRYALEADVEVLDVEVSVQWDARTPVGRAPARDPNAPLLSARPATDAVFASRKLTSDSSSGKANWGNPQIVTQLWSSLKANVKFCGREFSTIS